MHARYARDFERSSVLCDKRWQGVVNMTFLFVTDDKLRYLEKNLSSHFLSLFSINRQFPSKDPQYVLVEIYEKVS